MAKKNRGGKFLLGAALGVVAALLFAPKSGKETREELKGKAGLLKKGVSDEVGVFQAKVKEIFGQVDRKTKAKYRKINGEVMEKIAALEKTGKTVDKKAYEKTVEQVVDGFRSEMVDSREAVEKLKKMLKTDWEKVKKALGQSERRQRS